MRFATSIQNKNTFFTDDNGFEFLKREKVENISIGGNYYPSIYASFIRDDYAQLTVRMIYHTTIKNMKQKFKLLNINILYSFLNC